MPAVGAAYAFRALGAMLSRLGALLFFRFCTDLMSSFPPMDPVFISRSFLVSVRNVPLRSIWKFILYLSSWLCGLVKVAPFRDMTCLFCFFWADS